MSLLCDDEVGYQRTTMEDGEQMVKWHIGRLRCRLHVLQPHLDRRYPSLPCGFHSIKELSCHFKGLLTASAAQFIVAVLILPPQWMVCRARICTPVG